MNKAKKMDEVLWFDPKKQEEMVCFFKKYSSFGQQIQLDRGEFFFRKKNKMYIVKSGLFDEIILTEEGKESILFRLNEGTLFSEMEFFEQGEIDTHLKCVQAGCLCELANEQMQCILQEKDAWSHLLHSATRKYRILLYSLFTMRKHRLKGRLILFLMRFARTINHLHSDEPLDGVSISDALTHQEIANRLHADRSSVSEILSELKKKKLIQVKQKQMTILDEKGLLEMIEDEA